MIMKSRLALLGLVLALGGCMGGGGDPTTYSAALFGNPTNQPPERPTGPPDREYTCPGVDVMEGAAAYRIGRAGSSDVSFQASIVDVARECSWSGNQFSLRVGVQGRMVIGTSGRPGSHSAPLRIIVKRGDKVVASRVARVGASVSEAGASFAHVEEGIVLPIGSADPGDEYEIMVGFETGGRRR